MKTEQELTNCERYIWIIKYYGSLSGGYREDREHIVAVEAREPEEAMAMIRRYHDESAVFESVKKMWVVQATLQATVAV